MVFNAFARLALSRCRQAMVLAALAVLAVPVLAVPVLAQDVAAEPVSQMPASMAPDLIAPDPVAPESMVPGPKVPDKVQVQNLGEVEPFQVGARNGVDFVVSAKQWRGANAAVAARLISDLPEAGASPLLNQLAASVLMSPSEPPAGGKGDAALDSLRLGSVYRMGRLEAVIDLAERSPGGLSDPENAAIASRAFLALGRDDQACETASRLQNGRAAVFWLKLRAFCHARQGHEAAALLSADLAMEADPEDADFLLSLNHMLGQDKTPVQPINALELAMARHAGAEVQPAGAPLALMRALVRMPEETGIAAARHVAATGLLPVDTLAKLYLAWPETVPDEGPGKANPSAPLAGDVAEDAPLPDPAPKDKGAILLAQAQEAKAEARAALYYQSAVRSTGDEVKSQAIAGGLRAENSFAGFLFAARLYEPLLQTLPPEAVLSLPRRQLFAYALLAARKPKIAQTFVPADSADMARLLAIDARKPLSAMGTLEDGDEDGRAGPKAAGQVYIDLMALNALQRPLQAAHRAFLYAHRADVQDYAPCQAGARAAIRGGAQMKSRAATMLRAALMLADSGFDQAAPECSAVVIRALGKLGYRRAAQRGALEMMLGPRWRRMHHGDE